jgi:hypothetical protein
MEQDQQAKRKAACRIRGFVPDQRSIPGYGHLQRAHRVHAVIGFYIRRVFGCYFQQDKKK